jgi:ABC-2 type transport system ATP-binding protein
VCDRVGIIRDGRLITLSELDELRRIQLHRVEIDFGDESPVPEGAIRAAAEDVQVRGRHVTCTVSGSFDPLLNALRSSHVVDLVSTEPSLEEIFLSYFAESKPKAATS